MKQEEAQNILVNLIEEKNINITPESISFLMRSKFNNKPIYLFKFNEESGKIRLAVTGEINILLLDYTYQYIKGSLGIGVSSAKEKTLFKTIINYCIGRYLENKFDKQPYEYLNDIDFEKHKGMLFCNNNKYMFNTSNCTTGKNILQFYGITGCSVDSENIAVEDVKDLSSLKIDDNKYAVVGNFTIGGVYKSHDMPLAHCNALSFNISQVLNYGFTIEVLDKGVRIKDYRQFSPGNHRWSGDDMTATYLGILYGPFEE
ncbi:MAG: hypothetical protein N4A72_08640 [Bacteroidales bacterium]|jgi:hypothetical protein|nr:hypothetical protein [Bacteroidales bacterium]